MLRDFSGLGIDGRWLAWIAAGMLSLVEQTEAD